MKRLRDNQVENSVSASEKEKIRTSQDRAQWFLGGPKLGKKYQKFEQISDTKY